MGCFSVINCFLFIYFILFSKTYKLLLGILSVLTIFILYNFFFLFMDEVYYYLNLFLQINVSQLAFENIYLAGREQLFEEVWGNFYGSFLFWCWIRKFSKFWVAPHTLIILSLIF